jgi:hypothetical protein
MYCVLLALHFLERVFGELRLLREEFFVQAEALWRILTLLNRRKRNIIVVY